VTVVIVMVNVHWNWCFVSANLHELNRDQFKKTNISTGIEAKDMELGLNIAGYFVSLILVDLSE